MQDAPSTSAAATATTTLLESDPQPNSIKQDYRLDFTEVESALEPVPETQVMTNNPPVVTNTTTNPDSPKVITTTMDKEQMTDLLPNQAEFHIPESNASDIYSECSFMSNSQNFIR